MRKTVIRLALAVAMCWPLLGCEDTKARQENEQLKARVAELVKDSGDLGNRVDALTQENAALTKENADLQARLAHSKKPAKGKHHRKKHS